MPNDEIVTKDELEEIIKDVDAKLERAKTDITKEVKAEVKEVFDAAITGVFGDNVFTNGASNAFSTALNQAVAGKDFDLRTIANSTARAFTPLVEDFFRKSSAQLGDEIAALLGKSQRNS